MSARQQPGHRGAQPQVIDLFAGAGGWEEALRLLGYQALGVETDSWACTTARTAGHARLEADVSALDPLSLGPVNGLVASPPCQAYTVCGKRLGTADMPLVVACAHELAAGHDSRTVRLGECQDPRSLLSVEPLRWVLALRPRWLAFEQVPGVLGLWTLFAGLLGSHGYRSAAGVLSAERYGVAQTRARAFLIASLDGPVQLPEPTHCAYHFHHREAQACGSRLRPYRTMAQALGCPPHGVLHTNTQTHSGKRPRGLCRPLSLPAYTVDTSAGSWTLGTGRGTRITAAQAGALQGFRRGYPWQGSRSRQFRQVGNAVCPPLARRVLIEAMRPTREQR
jgi:DNA (cytosine-5)-methyltransferase 1